MKIWGHTLQAEEYEGKKPEAGACSLHSGDATEATVTRTRKTVMLQGCGGIKGSERFRTKVKSGFFI